MPTIEITRLKCESFNCILRFILPFFAVFLFDFHSWCRTCNFPSEWINLARLRIHVHDDVLYYIHIFIIVQT